MVPEEETEVWSIGIYTGKTLLDLAAAEEVENPVITAQEVSDVRAEFVADPFMISAEGNWHMFFEVWNIETGKGEIGWAVSANGLKWSYRQIVLSEPFHLSYPYVFSMDGDYYMIPETIKSKSVRLYRGDPFPIRWSLIGSILDGLWADPSIFFHDGRWWMFASPASPKNDALHLFYADSIGGPWRAHAMNPIVEADNRKARPGGRVLVRGDTVTRFAQDCHPYYGTQVRAFEISGLTTTAYTEREVDRSPVLSGGVQIWNRSGMHNIDPHWVDERWVACVDGWRFEKIHPARQFASERGLADQS